MVKQITAIYCDKETRGNGQDILIRRVIEIFDVDGKLIAENDSLSFTIEQIRSAWKDETVFNSFSAVLNHLMGKISEPNAERSVATNAQ